MDALCAKHYPVPMYMTLDLWRASVSSWLQGAARVIFPSIDTQARYARVYTENNYNAVSAWHIDHHFKPFNVPVKIPENSGKLKVLVVGAISKEKGAVLLEEVALALKGNPVEFILMGYAFRPLNNVIKVLGGYSDADIKNILDTVDADVVWYPAQWPETYSYTLSIALENGLPVLVPNIGAFSERVSGRDFSKIIRWDKSVSSLKCFFIKLANNPALLNDALNEANILSADGIEREKEFYLSNYILNEWIREGKLGIIDYKALIANTEVTRVISEQLSRKEVYLAKIWKIIQLPGIRYLTRLVPYRLQRYVKRRLSNRAIHEIVK
jgi:glycosyltransferase involved in cell wall biosynthesis